MVVVVEMQGGGSVERVIVGMQKCRNGGRACSRI